MVVHICSSSTSEAETEGLLQVEAYLVCTENLKCLKTKQKPETKPNHPASIWAYWYEITNKNVLWVLS